MNAIICDRCGAVLRGIASAPAAVSLAMDDCRDREITQQLCISCANDVRAFLEKKPVRVKACAWQPIATAPADGTRVLGWGISGTREIFTSNGDSWEGKAFSHWISLPEPPK